ncbi:MAG: BtrH N-terminal domain-containing protein [Bacteroidales bacterium]|nr:BtrH N-terminal domain-containing protein [Bacteroidales bacterium]
MSKIDYQHIQSAHCENGVTTGLLRHHGMAEINEPLIFGIGSGLFYIHIPILKLNNAPIISFRILPGQIFKRSCNLLGIKIISKNFRHPQDAQSFLEKKLNEGVPVGCRVGTYHLPYFPPEYRFHFNAHNIIVFGKDETHFYVSDPVMDFTSILTPEELSRVRYAKGLMAPKGYLYYPDRVKPLDLNTLKSAIVSGIKRNTRDMLYIPGNIAGVRGIAYTSSKIRIWRSKLGLRRAQLYLAQIVRMQEEIGTGGGGFRFLYAAFLEKAAEILNEDKLLTASDSFTEAGNLWRNAAVEMAGIYKGRLVEQKDFDRVADMLMNIYNIEKQAFKFLSKMKF